ncbi:MAG: FtsX-like permease family protein [Propionibacteriaceae bacterium]|nr:FtsX-like permease family protein [Propionibacteriaceae bacterium]
MALIIAAISVSVLINMTTSAVIADYRSRFGSEVSLDMNYQRAVESGQSEAYEGVEGVDEIPPQKYMEFAKSDYLKEVQLTSSTMIDFPGLKALDEVPEDDMIVRGMLIGTNLKTISSEFEHGQRRIIDGRQFAASGEVIISQQFAELNGLKVGDTIELNRGNDKPLQKMTIVGIYEDNTQKDGGAAADFMGKNPVTNRNNEIIGTIDNAESVGSLGAVSAKFFLKDPAMLADFTKEIQAKGLPNYYDVRTDEAGFNAVVGPVEKMSKVTNAFMVVVLALGGVIVLLMSTLAIRERKYEIGVLRAMGMKKFKLAAGFVTEMLALTALCLVVGFGVGAAVSQPITNSLLQGQIEAAQQTAGATSQTMEAGGLPGAAPLTALDKVDISLSAGAVGEIALMAILLAVLASVVSIVSVMRYEPMEILSDRN